MPGPPPAPLTVRFYATAQGSEPVRDWLASFDRPTLRAIGADLRTVQIGWPVGMPLVRKLAPDLWELRSRIASGIVRVLFTVVDTQIVLLHAFVKKSRMLPKDDLALARRRLQEVRHG